MADEEGAVRAGHLQAEGGEGRRGPGECGPEGGGLGEGRPSA